MTLSEESLRFEAGGLEIERSGWETCFTSLGLWVIFLSEDSLGEVEVEVVDCSMKIRSIDLSAVYGFCEMLLHTLMCCTHVLEPLWGKSLPARGIADAFTTMYTVLL